MKLFILKPHRDALATTVIDKAAHDAYIESASAQQEAARILPYPTSWKFVRCSDDERATDMLGNLDGELTFSEAAMAILQTTFPSEFGASHMIMLEGYRYYNLSAPFVTSCLGQAHLPNLFVAKDIGYRRAVTDKFRQAWEAAGLTGAVFIPVEQVVKIGRQNDKQAP